MLCQNKGNTKPKEKHIIINRRTLKSYKAYTKQTKGLHFFKTECRPFNKLLLKEQLNYAE